MGEYIKGEEILSDYVEKSKDISDDVMLTENKVVTAIFSTKETDSSSELLKIDVVDPQNREYSWEYEFYGSGLYGRSMTRNKDYFSFTPQVSGVHHIKISEADFRTDVKLISGMVNPHKQPLFLITLFLSFLIMLAGLFSLNERAIIESIKLRNLSINRVLNFCLAFSISLIIVYNVS